MRGVGGGGGGWAKRVGGRRREGLVVKRLVFQGMVREMGEYGREGGVGCKGDVEVSDME